MKVKNINSSSRKTRKLIKETFAILMKEKKTLSNITVTELVKRADITRSSFYTHYDSIYDVAQDLQNETLDVLTNNLKEISSIDDIDHFFDEIFKYLEKNEKIYAMILSSEEPSFFSNRLNIMINKNIHDALIKNNHTDLFTTITFFTDGTLDLIIKHYRKEIDLSLEDIKIFIKDTFKKLFFT